MFLLELPELSQNQARVLPLYNGTCLEAGFTFLCGFGDSGDVPLNGNGVVEKDVGAVCWHEKAR